MSVPHIPYRLHVYTFCPHRQRAIPTNFPLANLHSFLNSNVGLPYLLNIPLTSYTLQTIQIPHLHRTTVDWITTKSLGQSFLKYEFLGFHQVSRIRILRNGACSLVVPKKKKKTFHETHIGATFFRSLDGSHQCCNLSICLCLLIA